MADAFIIRGALVGAYVGLIIIGVKAWSTPESITARKFVVMNEHGHVALELMAEPSGAGLLVYIPVHPRRHGVLHVLKSVLRRAQADWFESSTVRVDWPWDWARTRSPTGSS